MEVFQMTTLSKLQEDLNLLFIHMDTGIPKAYLFIQKQEFCGSMNTVQGVEMKSISQKREKIMDGLNNNVLEVLILRMQFFAMIQVLNLVEFYFIQVTKFNLNPNSLWLQ